MADQQLATIQPRTVPSVLKFTPDQVELIKRTICAGASDDELALFLQVCKHKQLDPFNKEIHAVMRSSKKDGQWIKTMTIQTGIDGYRVMAERTGLYEGTTPPQWCGEDGQWVDVWLKDGPPAAARIGIYRKGWRDAIYRVARYKSYVQLKDGKPNHMWAKMPDGQLAKCAEALAFRATFPGHFGDLLTDEEMDHDHENVIPFTDSGPVEPPKPSQAKLPPAQGPLTPADISLLKKEISATAHQLKLPVRESGAKVLEYAQKTHGVEDMTQLTRKQFDDVFNSVSLVLNPPQETTE